MESLDIVFENIYQALENNDNIYDNNTEALLGLVKNDTGFSLFKISEKIENGNFNLERNGDLLCGIKNTSNEVITLDVIIDENKINELQLEPNETNFIYGEILLPLINFWSGNIKLKSNNINSINIELIYALLNAKDRHFLYLNKFYYKFNNQYLVIKYELCKIVNENNIDYQNMYELKSFKSDYYQYILK